MACCKVNFLTKTSQVSAKNLRCCMQFIILSFLISRISLKDFIFIRNSLSIHLCTHRYGTAFLFFYKLVFRVKIHKFRLNSFGFLNVFLPFTEITGEPPHSNRSAAKLREKGRTDSPPLVYDGGRIPGTLRNLLG